MSGEPDPLYVRARSALLDAVEVLHAHLDALVLVGAQAIYLHTGDADLAVAEYTTDADFAVRPGALADSPLLSEMLLAGGYTPREHPGGWLSPDGIYIDVMVPELLAGPGRRRANLGAHGRRVARRSKGLEGVLVDRAEMEIGSFDSDDRRSIRMQVAGSGALLVAKVHKIAERVADGTRVSDKDALDVLRLLQAIPTDDLVRRLQLLLADEVSSGVTAEAIKLFAELFAEASSAGVVMAVRAAGLNEDAETIALSMTVLAHDLRVRLT